MPRVSRCQRQAMSWLLLLLLLRVIVPLCTNVVMCSMWICKLKHPPGQPRVEFPCGASERLPSADACSPSSVSPLPLSSSTSPDLT